MTAVSCAKYLWNGRHVVRFCEKVGMKVLIWCVLWGFFFFSFVRHSDGVCSSGGCPDPAVITLNCELGAREDDEQREVHSKGNGELSVTIQGKPRKEPGCMELPNEDTHGEGCAEPRQLPESSEKKQNKAERSRAAMASPGIGKGSTPPAPGAASVATSSHLENRQGYKSENEHRKEPTPPVSSEKAAVAAVPEDPDCDICLEKMTKPRQLRCGHQFCSECLKQAEEHGHSLCPSCRIPYKPIEGSQPKGGRMTDRTDSFSLPGYPHCRTITITYQIPSGTQVIGHPEPGKPFTGTSRTAYLPDNQEGREVLKLLRKAFEARVTFTVGQSRTTGAENTVTWNDIHHKTSCSAGEWVMMLEYDCMHYAVLFFLSHIHRLCVTALKFVFIYRRICKAGKI